MVNSDYLWVVELGMNFTFIFILFCILNVLPSKKKKR